MAKKSFNDAPTAAAMFISTPAPQAAEMVPPVPEMAPEMAPASRAETPRETKSRRVQILLQPSLHRDAKAAADSMGISLNDFISRALQAAAYNDYVQGIIRKDTER